MAVNLYYSKDPRTGVLDVNAPVLTGQAGSLVSLLTACLVNGYTGKAAAGWTRPFTGTNAAVYRNNPTGGTGSYLQVDDNATSTSAGARIARMRGFESMTSQTVGTGAFPTTTQLANAEHVYKSATADATARDWILLADDKTFYLFTDIGPTGELNGYSSFSFGDVYSVKSGDAFRAIIIGRTAEANPGAMLMDEERMMDTALLSATSTGHYMPRTYAGAVQSATLVGKHCTDLAKRGLVPYPNPSDQGLYLAQLGIHEDVGAQGVVRGRLRGVWDFMHDVSVRVANGDTWSGSGALAGKSFLMVKPLGGIGTIRCLVLEISDTWETSS